MGWTGTHRRKGEATNKEWFAREFDGQYHKLLDFYTHSLTEGYGLLEVSPNGRKPYRIAVAVLMDWRNGRYNFYWKDMDETMGPNIANCPERILDRLSPVEDFATGNAAEWARNWRERCRENARQRKATSKKRREIANAVKAHGGIYVRLPEPIGFANGHKQDTFYIAKIRPERVYDTKGGYTWYRIGINSLIERGAEVMTEAEYEAERQAEQERWQAEYNRQHNAA
jgi:hypothetical protein